MQRCRPIRVVLGKHAVRQWAVPSALAMYLVTRGSYETLRYDFVSIVLAGHSSKLPDTRASHYVQVLLMPLVGTESDLDCRQDQGLPSGSLQLEVVGSPFLHVKFFVSTISV